MQVGSNKEKHNGRSLGTREKIPGGAALFQPANNFASSWPFRIFQDIQLQSDTVKDYADRLWSYSRYYDMSWQLSATQLDDIEVEVNDINRKVCRLETIRRIVAP